jgi:hypothetical protein
LHLPLMNVGKGHGQCRCASFVGLKTYSRSFAEFELRFGQIHGFKDGVLVTILNSHNHEQVDFYLVF